MSVTIDRVRTRAQLDDFITLPRRLYGGLPGFVAPLDHERRQMLDPAKGAFFTHGVASYWIARRGGTPVGRVSAQIDFAAVEPNSHETGMFGCLDAIDDGDVLAALLQTAERWLRERKRRIVRGPFLLSINGEPGLLVDGQLQHPVTELGWHPDYLGKHVEQSGYDIAAKLVCYTLNTRNFAFDNRLESLNRIRSRAKITVRPLQLNALRSEIELGRRLFNDGWRQNWGFTPATESDVDHLIKNFKPFIFSDCGFFIEVRGEPAAFILSIPNIFEITADLGPNPSAVGWLRLLSRIRRHRYRCFRVTLVGIAAQYQNTFLGNVITAVAFEEIRQRTRARDLDELVAGWILEQNHAMRRPLESLGFRHMMTYNVYEKAFETGLPALGSPMLSDVAEVVSRGRSQ